MATYYDCGKQGGIHLTTPDWKQLAQQNQEILIGLKDYQKNYGPHDAKPLFLGSCNPWEWIMLAKDEVDYGHDYNILVYIFPTSKMAFITDYTALRFNLLLMNTPRHRLLDQDYYLLTLPVLWSWEIPVWTIRFSNS